jgi:hypothetical protein
MGKVSGDAVGEAAQFALQGGVSSQWRARWGSETMPRPLAVSWPAMSDRRRAKRQLISRTSTRLTR